MISARPEEKKVDVNHAWLAHLNTEHNILKQQSFVLHNHWVVEPRVLNQSIDVLRGIAGEIHTSTHIVLFADVPFEHHYQAIAPYLAKWPIKIAGFKGLSLPVLSNLLAKLDIAKLELIGIMNMDNEALWFLYQILRAWIAAGNPPIPLVIGANISQDWAESFKILADIPVAETVRTHFKDFHEIIKNFASAIGLQHRLQVQLHTRDNGSSVTEQLHQALAANLDSENKIAIINAELSSFKSRSGLSVDELKLSLQSITEAKKTAEAEFSAKLRSAEERISALSCSNLSLKEELEGLNLLSPSAHEDVDMAVAKATLAYEAQVASLEALLKQKANDILVQTKRAEALIQQVSEITDQFNQAKVSASGLLTSVVSLTGINADLVKEKLALSMSLQTELKKAEEQKGLCETLAQTVDELGEQYSTQNDELETSNKLLAISQHTITALAAENTDLRFKLSSAEQATDMTDANSSSSHRKRKYHPESSEQKDSLRKQLSEATTKISIFETAAQLHQDRVLSDVKQYNEIKSKMDKQARELSTVTAELKRARTIRSDTITRQAEEIAQLKQDKIDLNTQLQSSKNKLLEAERVHRETEEANNLFNSICGSKLPPSPNLSLLFGNGHSLFPSPLPSPNLDGLTPLITVPALPGFTLGGR